MKCTVCGNELEDEVLECPYCHEKMQEQITEISSDASKQDSVNNTQDNRMFCKHCGTEIEEGKCYCKHCGNSIEEKGKKHCTQCGQVLEERQQFCDKCGQKVALVVLPKGIDRVKNKLTKKKLLALIAAFIVIIGLIVTAVCILPKLFISTEDFLVEGNYEKAYEKAKEEQKSLVIKENIVAVLSNESKGSMKDADSFVLRDAYVTSNASSVVLQIQGANSYGGNVTNWWMYMYSKEDGEFKLWDSISDFEEEEENEWDDSDEKLEKSLNNLSRKMVKAIINDEKNKLDSGVVDRINEVNKNGKLSSVELMDVAKNELEKNKDNEET